MVMKQPHGRKLRPSSTYVGRSAKIEDSACETYRRRAARTQPNVTTELEGGYTLRLSLLIHQTTRFMSLLVLDTPNAAKSHPHESNNRVVGAE